MRFIHTADWHLGRQFHNVSLIEDQRHVLAQIAALAVEAGVDALVVAGDVFDRAVPSPEAVALLDEFLAETVLWHGVPVVMIAGNHDSGRRLGFASRLLSQAGLHVYGRCSDPPALLVLADAHGPVYFAALPYAEPALVREATGEAGLHNHHEAMMRLAAAVRARIPAGERSVCVAHCFVAGGAESESERPLSVGGTGAVSPECFAGFDYAALGHLHCPQPVGERIHYSGSILKYSFSEIPHAKSVQVVELGAEGALAIERVPLAPLRDLRLLEGRLADLLAGPAEGENPRDFLLVRLSDAGALLDPMGRLRELYPNVLHLERPALERAAAGALNAPRAGMSDRALFATFFEQVTGAPLSGEQDVALVEVLESLAGERREAAP
jgi:DNA repair protein SbcD/Mre11